MNTIDQLKQQTNKFAETQRSLVSQANMGSTFNATAQNGSQFEVRNRSYGMTNKVDDLTLFKQVN